MIPTRANQVVGEHRVIGFDSSTCMFFTVRNRVVVAVEGSFPSYIHSSTEKKWDIPKLSVISKFAESIINYLELLYYPRIGRRNTSSVCVRIPTVNEYYHNFEFNFDPYTGSVTPFSVHDSHQQLIVPSLTVQNLCPS